MTDLLWTVLGYWFALAMMPIVFTNWGWKKILIPVGWALLKFLFKAFQWGWWSGFVLVLFMTPLTYRTWGFTLMHLIEHDQQFYYEYERDHDMSTMYNPYWRKKQGLPPLDSRWTWSPNNVEHALPTWTVIVIPIVVGTVIYKRYSHHKKVTEAIVVQHHGVDLA